MSDVNRAYLDELNLKEYPDEEKSEKKILRLILGDSSEEASGIPFAELRLKKAEYRDEYDSRKSKLTAQLYSYFDDIYIGSKDKDSTRRDKFFASGKDPTEKLFKFIIYMCDKFVPSEDKEILRYIRTSFKHCFTENDDEERVDESLEDKLENWKQIFKAARPDLQFDIQKNDQQEFLADLLANEYCAFHPKTDWGKKQRFYLTRIKEAAARARTTVESIEYADDSSGRTKADDPDAVNLNRQASGKEEERYRVLFEEIQKKYSKSQDREGKNTRRYLSALITIRLVREKNKKEALDVLFFDMMKDYEFSDKELLQELRRDFDNAPKGKPKFPKQKDIAARYVRNATGKERQGDDASRYLKPYVEIMKEFL